MIVDQNSIAPEPRQVVIYNRIGVLRAERNLSRQQLADAVGVNYQTIGFLERGNYSPSLKLAFQIAEFFKLPLQAVFSTKPFRPLSERVYGVRPMRAQMGKKS